MGIKSIPVNCFYGCSSLSSLLIPAEVTSINSNAFLNCFGVKEYHFLSVNPPKLANTQAFNNIPDDCIIYVPQSGVEAYKAETNWTVVADKIQEEPV